MSFLWIILIMLVLFGLGWLGWLLWTARSIKKIVANKVYVTRLLSSGDRVELLGELDGNTVRIPTGEGSAHSEPKYASVILTPKNTFNMLYPPGPGWPPPWVRATVRSTVVQGDVGKGWEPFEEGPTGASGEEIEAIKKEAAIRGLIREGEAEFSGDGLERFPIKPRYFWLAIGVLLILALVAAVVGLMSYSEVVDFGNAFGM